MNPQMVATTNDKKQTNNPAASHHHFFNKQTTLQHHITMVFVQWALLDEFEKEVINWEWVCMFINANPAVCRVRDDYRMYPLHDACYSNAPFHAIQFFVRTWCEALKEVPVFSNGSTGYFISNDWKALELACDANAPVEVIKFLADTTHGLGFSISNMAERILTERN